MKQLGMKSVGLLVLLGVVLMTGYYFYRQSATDLLSHELREVREEITRKQLAEIEVQEQSQLLLRATDLASFVESLYKCAQRTGVTEHEVTTSLRREQTQTRRSRKSQPQSTGEGLKINRLQVSLRGDFRRIAEYLRAIQELDRLQQIESFDMTADKDLIKMSLTLDLYALKGLDES